MIREIGKAIESFGDSLMSKSATMYKGAKYTVVNGQKTGRVGGRITAKGALYGGLGKGIKEIGQRPYMATGVVGVSAAAAGLKARSSGARGLQGMSSGANGLRGMSSGASGF